VLQSSCKRSRYSNRAVGNLNERAHSVVYDKFMKQIRTVRHSFNTTGMANYRVQLAVPSSTNHNHNNIVFFFKLTNKYTKKLGKTVVSLLCFP